MHLAAKRLLTPALIIGALGIALGGAVLFLFDPAQNAFYPTCMLHRTTGLLCPGCGGLRAAHQLLHGNIRASLQYNPLLVVSFLLGTGVLLRVLFYKARNQPPPAVVVRPLWLWSGGVLLLAFCIVRNLPIASMAGLVR